MKIIKDTPKLSKIVLSKDVVFIFFAGASQANNMPGITEINRAKIEF